MGVKLDVSQNARVDFALQAGGGLDFNYLTVAFIAFVNAALCAAALFVEE